MIPADWPPRFQPHDHVIDLLIGPQLYTSTDVAVRELLQNAEDACALVAVDIDGYTPRMTVAYSPSGNWCEFSDNGLGMNRESVQGSFAWIGAPKTEVTHIRQRLEKLPSGQRQIAQFGIGILSCFGVASSIDLHTRMDGADAIALRVTDYHKPFVALEPDVTLERGTRIRLALKSDGPMKATDVAAAVRRYARHTHHVTLVNADTGADEPVQETWLDIPSTSIQTEITAEPGILSGRLALHPAWLSMATTFTSELVTCNGGFLVSERDLDVLPPGATGFRGEINIEPGALTILMNREGFKRDELWAKLSVQLWKRSEDLLSRLLDNYEEMIASPNGLTDSVERGMVLLSQGAIRGLLSSTLGARVDSLLPQMVSIAENGSNRRRTLADLKSAVGPGGVVYFVRDTDGRQQRQKAFSDSGSTVQVTETMATTSLRALQLQARGHVVVSCHQRGIPHVTTPGNQNLQVQDLDLLSRYAGVSGFTVQSVNDAPAEFVNLAPLPQSALINEIFEAADGLRLVYLPKSDLRVLSDFTGRLINAAHPDIQALLKVIPASIGNPVLRTLIQVYIDIDNFEQQRARGRLQSLLEDPELADKAQLETSTHLRAYLERRLKDLAQKEGSDD